MNNDKEQQSIDILTSHLPQAPVPFGIGDDCALIEDQRLHHVVTMDSMVEHVHFDDRWSAADVGWKLVASNVSDIASMGRVPNYCTFAISLPDAKRIHWLPLFRIGFLEALQHWNIHLVGGDITSSPNHIFLSLTLHSTSEEYSDSVSKAIFRCGAQIDDDLYVTGNLGNAAAYFFGAISTYVRPMPSVAFADAMRKQNMISSMMDISDGLSKDARILCERSGVSAHIYVNSLPHTLPLEHLQISWLTSFGEDFELLFTSSRKNRNQLQDLSQKYGVKITKIGVIQEMRKDECLQLYDAEGTKIPFPQTLFQHFS